MSALRLFLAIDIPPRAREIVTTVQNRFKTLGFKISLVRPGNIHLTLKFLGDTPLEQVANIKKSVSEAVDSISVFKVALDGVGVFPNFKKPRVLWIGLKDPHKHLKVLQENIDSKMMQLGFPREGKKFDPHLTLARIKHGQGKIKKRFEGLKQEVESVPLIDSEFFQVDSVKLIQSELTPKGSIYTILEKFPLRKAA